MNFSVYPCTKSGKLLKGFCPCSCSSAYEALSLINKLRNYPFIKVRYYAISVNGLGYSVLPIK